MMPSNDEQQSLQVEIINDPDEKSSSATMNDLPNEILPLIFKHLKVQDLFRCRLVCKRFMFFCDEVKIPELMISNETEDIKEVWFNTNKPVHHTEAIDITTYKMYQSTFRLNEHLQRLYFKGSYTDYMQLNLNDLSHLEQLRLEIFDVQRLYNLDGEALVIDVPNLKILEFGYFEDDIDIYITAPKLEMLKYDKFQMTTLIYPETVVHLEMEMYSEALDETSLKELRYLKVNGCLVPSRHILSAYPKLTKFVCNECYYYGNDEYNESMNGLRELVEQKRILKRHDLKIYYQSVEIIDSSKIDEFMSSRSILAFQMNNYDSLCDNIYYDIPLEYNELMRLVKGKLPHDFHQKFINVHSASVTNEVRSFKHLEQFLTSFDFLNELRLEKTWLDQSFYDRLPAIGHLTKLTVEMNLNPISNYDFLFKLKRLKKFRTDRHFPCFPDFSLALFKELKHFDAIHFYFDEEFIAIGKHYISKKYEFKRFKDRKSSRGRKLIFEKNEMNFDELVDLVEDFKTSKQFSSNVSD